MPNEALGLIEVTGFLGAVVLADTCLKATNVELIQCEVIRGGLTTVELTGDVGAVNANLSKQGKPHRRLRLFSIKPCYRKNERRYKSTFCSSRRS